MATTRPGRPTTHRPTLYRLAGIVRILVGLFFLFPGITKFTDHAAQTALFEHWRVPLPAVAVVAVGVLELVAAALLIAGVWMPLPALALGVDMAGALVTAGRIDGGERLVIPAVVLVLLAFILSQWGGAFQRGNPPAFIRSRLAAGPRRR